MKSRDPSADLEHLSSERRRGLEEAAQFLFGLLDDIDTASDRAKADDKLYRELVERLHRRRFEVASTDGYTVTFHERQP